MELRTEIKRRLRSSRDWSSVIEELEKELDAVEAPEERSERLFELGQASEEIVPDRDKALAMFQKAWKLNPANIKALSRARAIYREMGRLEMVAKLGELELKTSPDASRQADLHAMVGEALLDLAQKDKALEHLTAAAKALPDRAAVQEALAAARYNTEDWLTETEDLIAQAAAADSNVAAKLCLRAARILHFEMPDDPAYESTLRKVLSADPQHEQANALLEGLLAKQERWKELQELHDKRAYAAPDESDRAELYRRFATTWTYRFKDRERGAAFLAKALTAAFENGAGLRGQVAAFQFLRDTLGLKGDWATLVKLADQALRNRALGEDEKLYTATLGGTIAWKELKDVPRAREYFVEVAKIDPENSMLLEFSAAVGAGPKGSDSHPIVSPSPAAAAAAPPPSKPSFSGGAAVLASLMGGGAAPTPPAAAASPPAPAPAAAAPPPAAPLPAAPAPAAPAPAAAAPAAKSTGVTPAATAGVVVADTSVPTLSNVDESYSDAVKAAMEAARTAEAAGPDKGIDAWRKVIAANPTLRGPRRELGRVLRKAERWNVLVDALREEIDKTAGGDDKVALLLEQADIYKNRLKQDSGYINSLNAILALRPGNLATLDQLAAQYDAMKRWPDLVGVLQKRATATAEKGEKVALLLKIATLFQEKFSNQTEAIKTFEQALELEPENPAALDYLKGAYEKRRDWEKLIAIKKREIERVADVRQRTALLIDVAKLASDKLKKPSVSIDLWGAVVSADPENVEALGELEKLYEREKQWEALAEVVSTQARMAPDAAKKTAQLQKLGILYAEKLNDNERAIRAWRLLLDVEPDNRRAQDALKKLYLTQKQWTELESFYAATNKLDEYVRVLERQVETEDDATKLTLSFRIGELYRDKLQKNDRAARAFEKVLSLDAQHLGAAEALIPLYEQAKDPKKLAGVLEVQLGHTQGVPERQDRIRRLAELVEKGLKDKGAAYGWYLKALDEDPHAEWIRADVERLAKDTGGHADLVSAYERAIGKLGGGLTALPLMLVVAKTLEEELGEKEKALEINKQILALDESNEAAVGALERLYVGFGRHDDLLGIYRKKLDLVLDPEEQKQIRYKLASVYEDAVGDAGKAAESYRSILEAYGDELPALRALDRLYQQGKQHKELADTIVRQLALVSPGDDKTNVELKYRLGQLRETHLSDVQGAIDSYRDILDIQPEHEGARVALEKRLGETDWQLTAAGLLEPVYQRLSEWQKLVGLYEIQLAREKGNAARVDLLTKIGDLQAEKLGDPEQAFNGYARTFREDPANDKARGELARLSSLIDDGWERVVKLYEVALTDGGVSPALGHELAMKVAEIYDLRLENPGKAIEYYRRAQQIEPDDATALEALDKLYTRDSKWQELVDVYKKKIELAKDGNQKLELYKKLATLWEEMLGNVEEAIATYKEVLAQEPTNVGALKAQDRLLETQGAWTELADNLSRQLQLSEDKAETVALLVRLAALRETKLSETAAAVNTYRQALDLDLENEAALKALERLISQPEHELAIANILEPIYRVQDNWIKQVGVYEIMVKHALDPARKIELLHRIAELYEVGGDDGPSAFKVYDRALREDPSNTDTQSKLDRLAREQNRFPDLITLYDEVQKNLLDNELRVSLLQKIAHLHELELGDDEKAVETHKRILEVDPRNLPAANAIEQVHTKNADYARLVEALLQKSEIVNSIDDKKSLAFKAAQTYEDVLESPEKAIGVYRHVLEWDETDPTAMEALERLYIRLERWQDLKDIYSKKAELAKDPQEKKQMLYVLGQVYDRELGDVPKAIETYQGILDIDGEDVTAIQALDRLYATAGRWYDLLAILDREVELAGASGETVGLKYRIGQLWEKELKDLVRAIEAYREAVNMDPGHEPTLAALDGLAHRDGEPVAAALVLEPIYEQSSEFEKLIDLLEVQAKHAEDPLRRVELLHRIADLQERRLENHAAAFDAHARALKEDPANEQTLGHLERLADGTRAWDKLAVRYEEEIGRTLDVPRQVDLLQRVARVYEEELGQPEKAITTLKRVLDVEPENRATVYKLDRLFEGQQRWKELADILRREIALGTSDDEVIGVQFRLGQVFELQLKDLPSAIQVYRDILASKPDHGPTITSLELMFSEGNYQREIAQILEPLYRVGEQWEKLTAIYEVELEKLTESTERLAMFQRLAEISEQKLLDEVRAFQWWGRAFSEDPRAELAGEEVERLAQSTGSWAELVGVYSEVLAIVQDPALQKIALLKVARVYDQELHDAQRAEESYLRVLAIDPKDAQALAALDKIYEHAGMYPELAEILRRRVEITMDSEELTQLHFRLGRVYTDALDQHDDAIKAYEVILDADSRNAKALEALERIYFKREEYTKLYGIYEKMVDIAVGDEALADVYAHMARIASEAMQKDDEAQDLWNRVIDLRGEDPTALVALADIYERRELWRELVDILERTVRICTRNEEKIPLHKRLGRIWSTKLGRERNAIEAWSKALELDPGDLESLRAMCALYRSTQAWEELSGMLRRLIDVGVTSLEDDELQQLYSQLGELEGDVLMRPNEATDAWRRVLQLDPGDFKALGALETIFTREARWEDLIDVLEKKSVVLDDKQQRIDVLLQAAATYEDKLTDKQSAAQLYERVRAMDGANMTASTQLEAIYREQYNWEKLNEVLLERVEHTPDVHQRIATLQNVAKIFEEERSDPDSAFVVLQAAFKEDYSNDSTAHELERLATSTNKWSDLLQDYIQVVQALEDPKAKADLWVKIGRWYGDNLHQVEYAISSVQQALGLDPNHVGALSAMADFHRKRGSWNELVDVLQHHAKVDPDPKRKVELYLSLAELLESQMGDPPQAIVAFKAASEADPEHPSLDALLALDRLYRREMHWPDLIGVLEKRAKQASDPDEQIKLKLEIANLYDSYLDDTAHAIAAYRDVVTIDARNLAALRALESLYEKTGQSESYLDVLENQLDASGTDAERISLYQRMAIAWEERFQKAERAWECLEKVLMIDPRSQGTFRELERLYRQERRWESLVDAYRRHIDSSGDPALRVELYSSMGQIYEDELREYDRAIEAYNDVLAFDGDDHNALNALGRLYEKIEDWDRAVQTMGRLVDITDDPKTRVELNYRLGKVTEDRMNDPDAAEERYVTALSQDPSYVPAMSALTEHYKKRGDWQKAANMMVRAEAHTTNPLEKIRLLAESGDVFHKKLHDEARAIESFAKVIELDPEHVQAGEPLAEMYFAEQRWQELEPILDMLIRKAGKKTNTELHSLYFRLARTTDELGKVDKSLKYYKQSYDIDSTHLPTLLGRANLLYKQEDWDNAGKIYQTILVQHRDAQKPQEIVEIYYRLGIVRLKLGERKKALNMFEKALEIDAGHKSTLLAVIDLQQQQNDWEAVIHAKRALLAGGTADDKFKLLHEIGDIYADKLNNPQKGIAAFQEALEVKDGDFPTLQKLLERYGETKQWKKVVEVSLKFGELEKDPVRRGKYLYTAGVISRDELKALDEAIEYYNQALDSYFERPEALTPAALPQYLKAFEAIDKVATSKKDWKQLERNYRRMIKRLPAGAQNGGLLTLLWHNLGEIYRTRMKNYDAAIASFEVAQTFDPENKPRAEILAELYLVGGPEHAPKAIAQHAEMIKKDPFKIDSYKVLFKIYMDAHAYDKAWCIAAALVFLKRADATEQQLYEQYRVKGLAKAKQRLTDDAWKYIFHPNEDRYVGAILGSIWNAIALMKAQPHKAFNLRRKDKRDVATDQLLFSKIFNYVNQVLNVPQPELYLMPDRPMGLALANTEEKKTLIPSFVVGSELLAGRPDAEIAFAVASRLSYMKPEHYLKLAIPTVGELKIIVLAALKLMVPNFPIKADVAPTVQQYMGAIQQYVQPHMLEQLGMVVQKFLQTNADVDLHKWSNAVELTSHRVGYILSGDLETAAKMISQEPVAVGGMQPKEKITELILYAISEPYFEVRKHLGLSIG